MKPYFECDGIVIYHGDNREVLPCLASGSVGLVFTSPPYNLGNSSTRFGCHAGTKMRKLKDGYGLHGDDLPHGEYVSWQHFVLSECWRVLRDDGAIFYNHKPRVQDGKAILPLDLNPGLPLRQIIIWDRGTGINLGHGFYAPSHEWVAMFAKEAFRLSAKRKSSIGDVWRINPETDSRHPAPFPVALPLRAISSTDAEIILDHHMGSGTTIRAAKDAGRKAIGVEIEERYCEVAAKRLQQGVFAWDA